ncbi:MAG: AraC family transcriptional regulator [Rhodoglobus sp.]|nr:AraC family transcriptional regulator [Rhodoglobus sp.]
MAAKPVDLVSEPRLEERPEIATVGIREIVPFRAMLSNRDRLLAELIEWLDASGVEPEGPFFLRLHVVDMSGLMDIEVGVAATAAVPSDRVIAGVVPAGAYAVLSYRSTSLAANGMLLRWIDAQGLATDSDRVPAGEAFRSRLEVYLTDPRTEKRKTKWVVELAFLTRVLRNMSGPVPLTSSRGSDLWNVE